MITSFKVFVLVLHFTATGADYINPFSDTTVFVTEKKCIEFKNDKWKEMGPFLKAKGIEIKCIKMDVDTD